MQRQSIPFHKAVVIPRQPLKAMFQNQALFQRRFHNLESLTRGMTTMQKDTQEYLDSMLTHMIQETCEAREWTHFKSWKKYPKKWTVTKRREFLNELIDVQHFLINTCLGVGCDHTEFTKLFFNKQQENINRQTRKGGYKHES